MSAPVNAMLPGVEITGPMEPRFEEILTKDAVAFLAGLHRHFDATRLELLARRQERLMAYGRFSDTTDR